MERTHLKYSYGQSSKPSCEYSYWDKKNRKQIICCCDTSTDTIYHKHCPVIFHAKSENNDYDIKYRGPGNFAENHSPSSLFTLSLYAVNHITLEHFLPIKVLTQFHKKNNSINKRFLNLNPDYILHLKDV